MSEIPVISLWQPYASLIFARMPGGSNYVKQHETRGFKPPLKHVGKCIGIHATAKFPPLKSIPEDLHELCMDVFGCSYNFTLPQGAILGVVRVSAGRPTADVTPWDEDRIAGDWTHGRFAWPLSVVARFEAPIPAKGKQGWWRFPIPGAVSTPGSSDA
jgi:hypothetical protein